VTPVSTLEVVAISIIALAALGVIAFVLCRIIDKAKPAPLDSCLREAHGLVAALAKRRSPAAGEAVSLPDPYPCQGEI
jgi:hypothetical protein